MLSAFFLKVVMMENHQIFQGCIKVFASEFHFDFFDKRLMIQDIRLIGQL